MVWWSGGLTPKFSTQKDFLARCKVHYTKTFSFAIQSLVHKKNFFRDPKFSTQKNVLSIQSLVHKKNFFRDPKFSTQKKFLARSKV